MLDGHAEAVLCLVTLLNGDLASSGDATIRICDSMTGLTHQTLKGHQDCVLDLLVVPKSGELVSCSRDATIILWDTRTGRALRKLTGHTERVNGLALMQSGELASASDDGSIRIWTIGQQRESLF